MRNPCFQKSRELEVGDAGIYDIVNSEMFVTQENITNLTTVALTRIYGFEALL